MDDEEEVKLDLEERKKSKFYINADGMAYSVMAGLGDAYLPAALVLLGASNFMIGMLAALPQFFGAVVQFLALPALRIFGSRKKMVMASASVQALCWLPIAALLFWPTPLSAWAIILLFSVGFGASLFANPAWSSWVADIVLQNERAGFFANRNRLMQIMLFISIFAAGFAINQMQLQWGVAIAFGVVFLVAFGMRVLSVTFLLKTADVKYEITLTKEIGLKHLFLLPSYKNEIWFLAFVALMNFTVQFASPFFTPYMLNTLHMEVSTLGMLTAIAIVAKVISYRYWGKAIDRFSNRTVLITTSLLAPIVPLLWLLSGDVWMLALFQVFSGFVWSGYEIAVFNTALSMVGRELRPSFISKYNAFSAFANGLGAIAGGAFLLLFPNLFVLGFSGILLVFLLSGLMRLAVSAVFAPKLAKSKDVENLTDERAVIFKLIAVYPTLGAVSQVQNGWDFTRKIVRDGAQNSGIMLHEGIEATEEIVREEGRKLITKISRRGRL